MRVHVWQQVDQVVQQVLNQSVTLPLIFNHGGAERNAAQQITNTCHLTKYTTHPHLPFMTDSLSYFVMCSEEQTISAEYTHTNTY